MAKKYIGNSSGSLVETEATVSSAGAGNAGDIVALDTDGRLNPSVMPVGIGADTIVMLSSEALTAGDLINIWNDAGTQKARKADCSNGRRAHGFVIASFGSGVSSTIYRDGSITGLSGLTPGAQQFLSTAGARTETAPTTSGYLLQEIGIANTPTQLDFSPQRPITLA